MDTAAGIEANGPETADIETSSEGYAARFSGAIGAWMLEQQAAIVCDMLPPPPATVLDVGGGHGQLAGPLARAGYRVTVLGSAVECSKRIEPELKTGRVEFVVGNVIDLPFSVKAFDAVVSVRLLPHCRQWPRLITELSRVARSRVIVDYPLQQPLLSAVPFLFTLKKKFEKNTRTWTAFSHRQVSDEFAKQGWDLQRRVGQFVLPMVLHRMMKCRAISAGLERCCRGVGLARLTGSPVLASFMRRS